MLHKNTSSAEQSTVEVEIQILPDATDFDIPCYATEFIAGVDLRAAVEVLQEWCGSGTIDADYRGQIKVCLANLSDQSFTIKRGDKIAHMIVAKHEKIDFKIVETLDQTKRSDGGFGSTGER